MTEGFSDRPFAVGTVVGLRAFRLRNGQLGAATRDAIWQPGENVARCIQDPILDDVTLPEHPVGSLECRCGFYAFFSTRNDYMGNGCDCAVCQKDWVAGIIAGYGIVTIGSKGFRANKARIVALVVGDEPWNHEMRETLNRTQPGVPIYPTQQEALAQHPTTQPQDVGIEPEPDTDEWQSFGFTASGMTWNVTIPQVALPFARGGVIKPKPAEPDTRSPIERKRAATQAAADARTKAGLRNVGGINRRQRKLP